MARDSGRRRNTHALDAQTCDLIELPSSAAKPAVCSRRVRAERAPADCAPVPLPSAGLRRERAVAHDVKARLSTVVTPGGSARHPIGPVHCSSVPAGETPRFPHDFGGAADRSIANGASTRRWLTLADEITTHDRHLARLTAETSPTLREGFAVGANTAAAMLIIFGDNPERIRSEAAFAKLCGACPIPASSGMTTGRHRLYRGGHRQANAALH